MAKMKRREFLKYMGLGAGSMGAAAFTKTAVDLSQAAPTVPQQTAPLIPEQRQEPLDWQEMDEHHKESVDYYLERAGDPQLYADFWIPEMKYTMDGDVKVFEINCALMEWETELGKTYPAFTYNGRVPGPTIRVNEGDNVRFNVTNDIPDQSTAIHWHGLILPNSMDGVPYITQEPITPGSSFTYEWTIREGNIGSHMYHSHHNSAEQTTRGMLGAFIVDPRDTTREPEVDADYVLILNDSALGFTLNGKGFPDTQPIIAKLGDRIRVRYMNEGLMIHPMHLHGIPQMVFAKDGFYLPVPFMCDTLNIAPGERYDVIIECTEPGAWAYHCHILTHAESRDGMFGMVTALVVTE